MSEPADEDPLQSELAANRQRIEIEYLKAALRDMAQRLAARTIDEIPEFMPPPTVQKVRVGRTRRRKSIQKETTQ